MDHLDDTADERTVDDLHCDERCDSTFDRWQCTLPPGHPGAHRSVDGHQRTEWNDRVAGRRLRDLARPAELAERAARALSDRA